MAATLLSTFRASESQLLEQITYDFLSTNIQEVDQLLEGFPRGAITEICGSPSSGRSSLVHSFLASATRKGEFCAIVDASDAFDPSSADICGADLPRLLWIRCGGNLEHAMRAVDLLLHAGGWGAVVLDLAGISSRLVRRIPISYWYRFRRAVENKPTVLVVIEREPYVGTCAAMALELKAEQPLWTGAHHDFRLLSARRYRVLPRKPIRPAAPVFAAKAHA